MLLNVRQMKNILMEGGDCVQSVINLTRMVVSIFLYLNTEQKRKKQFLNIKLLLFIRLLYHSWSIRLTKFNSVSVLHIPIEHADDVNKLYFEFL